MFPNCTEDRGLSPGVEETWENCVKSDTAAAAEEVGGRLRIFGNNTIPIEDCDVANKKCSHVVRNLGELVKYDFYFVAISSAACGAMESNYAEDPVTVRTIQDLTPFRVTAEKTLATAAEEAFEGQQITLPATSGGGGGGTMVIAEPLMFSEKLIVLVGSSSTTTVVECTGGRFTNYLGSHPTEIRGMEIARGRAGGGGHRRLGSGSDADSLDGGALYLKELESHLTIEDVVFRGNSAAGKGGAICVKKSNGFHLAFKDVSFIDNVAQHGGAISIEGAIQVGFTFVRAISNFATIDGGAIHAVADVVAAGTTAGSTAGTTAAGRPKIKVVGGSSFFNNTADTGAGGAIFLSSSDLQMINTTIDQSTAHTSGGALSALSAITTFERTTISSNLARTGNGGGISAMASSVTMSSSSIVESNTAKMSGGGMWVLVSHVILEGDGTRLDSNVALDDDGGGIFALTQVRLIIFTLLNDVSLVKFDVQHVLTVLRN
jgi:predicted outer membrane repeat protein